MPSRVAAMLVLIALALGSALAAGGVVAGSPARSASATPVKYYDPLP
ncbi:MAG: hypothetical protein ICV73_10240 [Acetobacteraceae bacterium]|nr:hypothetical protein [Acetobacteraceae bacterium]